MKGRIIEIQIWRVLVWARICWLLSFVVGVPRAERWARAGAMRLVRYRLGGFKCWHGSTCTYALGRGCSCGAL